MDLYTEQHMYWPFNNKYVYGTFFNKYGKIIKIVYFYLEC